MPALTSERVEIGVGVAVTRTEEAATRAITRTEAIHSASRILLWNAVAVPWVARTEAYTHALLSGRPISQEDPSFAAMFRTVEAQVVLDRTDTQKIICLGATALSQRYSDDPFVHRQQLQRLLDISSTAGNDIRLHVLPHSVNASMIADRGAITLYEHASRPPIVEEESWTNGVVLTDSPSVVSEIQMVFAAIQQHSLDHETSIGRLQETIDQLS